jgi:predicted dehydrogenase
MNELQVFSTKDPPDAQGFRTILVTEPEHPYMKNWWPPGHIVGYEHAFVHATADFLRSIAGRERGKSRPKAGWIEPNFHDGVRIMQVLEAGMESARTSRAVKIGERKRWARTVCAGEAEHRIPPTIRKGGRDGRRAR